MSPPPTLLERAGARVRARRVSLMASPAYLQALHKVNVHKGRDVMLVDLAESSGLTEWVTVVAPAKATTVHLTRFHSEEYIRILREADPLEESASYQGKDADGDNCDDTERQRGIADEANTEGDPRQKRRRWDKQQPACPEDSGVARSGSMAACSLPLERLRRNSEQCKLEEDFGLEDDCSPFAGHFDYSCRVAGASIQAADLLARGSCDVAINWGGGRHHAKKACAAGFCFVNDCVLACTSCAAFAGCSTSTLTSTTATACRKRSRTTTRFSTFPCTTLPKASSRVPAPLPRSARKGQGASTRLTSH